jgi:RHS repeat-associated protein
MRWTSLVLLATFVLDSTALTRTAWAAPRIAPAASETVAAAPVVGWARPTPVPAPAPGRMPAPLLAAGAVFNAAEVETTFGLGQAGPPTSGSPTFEHAYPAGWSLASVPLVPDDAAPAAVFDGIPAPLRLYDYVQGHVVGAGEPGARSVAPGRAYWLLLQNPVTVRVSGQPVATGAAYTIALQPGWNAIATPWLFATEWTNAQVSVRNAGTTLPLEAAAAATWIDAALEEPLPGGGYQSIPPNSAPAGRLLPWRGYELFSRISGELILAPPPPDSTPPTVSFTGLADGATVTAPIQIAGAVGDENLVEWRLQYASADGGVPIVIGSGHSAVNGVLGTFDPTTLLNGIYQVQLVAVDAAGTTTTSTRSVVVSGDLKVGNFSLSFLDLEVPVAGLPIRVTRTYDSRDKRRGDFGIGWRVEVANLRLSRNVPAGLDWDGTRSGGPFIPNYCLEPARTHLVTVTFPDGKVHEFDAETTPRCQQIIPPRDVTVIYKARPGTLSTLEPTDGGSVIALGSWPGPMQLVDWSTLELYDPQQFRLTLPDGRSFVIHRQQGLQSITDANGNQLLVGPNGIVHSSGKGVAFTRDGLGRITAITDPAGEVLTYAYDARGDLETVTDRDEHVTHFAYNNSHGLTSIEDERGVQPIRNEYDESGRLVRHIDASGHIIEYGHDVAGRQEVITDRLGGVRVLEYDERGLVVRETDPSGKVTSRTFDAAGNRTTETSPQGETTTWTYDGRRNVTSIKDHRGATTSFTYDLANRVLTTTNPLGKVTTNAYDGRGNLTSITDADGKVTSTTYDAAGNPLVRTDATGCTTQSEYDAGGNLVRQVDGAGSATTYTYDANGNRLTETRTRTVAGVTESLVTRHVYDGSGRVLQTTTPDGAVTRQEYDAAGQQTATVDALGRRTTFLRDDVGRVTRTTYPDTTTEETTYDAEGRRLTSTDRSGRVTTYEYDSAGRLIKTTHPSGGVVSTTYDGTGRVASTTDARGNTTRYEYDGAGNRTRIIDALGQVTASTFDLQGNELSVRDARNQTTTFEYDAVDRRIRAVFPDGTARSTEYDGADRVVAETDQAGRTTRFTYDCDGRLSAVTDALNKVTSFGYDELGNRIRVTDANGRITRFEYDRQGRETRRILPTGQAETREYDLAGNLVRRTDFGGAIGTYDYDAGDRLLARHYPDGTSVAFTYTPSGQRATATDARGVTRYEYEAGGRLQRLTYPDGRRLDYAHDAHGNRTSLTARAGLATLATTYAYDPLNRPIRVVDPMGRTYTTGYDAAGNRSSLAFPNGVSTAYTYDSLNRLVDLTSVRGGATLLSFAYTLGPAGHRTRVAEQDGAVRTYNYDVLYRLVGEQVTGAQPYQKTFTYDAVGNRLLQTDSTTGQIAYTYDERDRLLTEGGATYFWSDNGDLTAKPGPDGATMTWDFDHRLRRAVKVDGTVVTHAYDADGNRVRTEVTPATGPPQVTDYLVDPSGALSHVVLETDGAGTPSAYYVRGDDVLAVIRGASTKFLHADGQGSIRRLTDESGVITDAYTYTAFGELIAHIGTDPNPYQFAGEARDPNLGFYYNRARWLDVGTGRFLSADPFDGLDQDPASLHKYLYAHADPVNRLDPSGLFSIGGMCASISIQVTLFAMAHPTLLAVIGFVAAMLMPAEVSNSLTGSGFPPFQALGRSSQLKFQALQLIKSQRFRDFIKQALTKSDGGRMAQLLGDTFENLVKKSFFPGAGPGPSTGRHVADLTWRNWLVEIKSAPKLDSRGRSQLAEFAGHAADEGSDLLYVFLNKPGDATIRAINKVGGVVGYIFE